MQQYIVGNWKMNGTNEEAKKLASGFLKRIEETSRPLPHIILCPSYPYLLSVVDLLKDSPIKVGAQDCHPEKSGAFTGDVSVSQLVDVGCSYVIVGHSERRRYHKEDSKLIQRKIEKAIKSGLKPILCVGENDQERKSGRAPYIVAEQLSSDLPPEFKADDLLIAYEPLWSIGTGHMPTMNEVEEMVGLIKHELSGRISGAGILPALYGGSVTEKNAPDLLDLPHVDGLLVGGLSLKLDEFWEVVNASHR